MTANINDHTIAEIKQKNTDRHCMNRSPYMIAAMTQSQLSLANISKPASLYIDRMIVDMDKFSFFKPDMCYIKRYVPYTI